MGFFNTRHISSTPHHKINWVDLNTIESLDNVIENQNRRWSLIFKHSTRCEVSRMALHKFQNNADFNP